MRQTLSRVEDFGDENSDVEEMEEDDKKVDVDLSIASSLVGQFECSLFTWDSATVGSVQMG